MNALTRTLFRHVSRSIDSTRPICTSKVLSDIFTIQDEKDFEVRVVKSDVPIVVDFYAK